MGIFKYFLFIATICCFELFIYCEDVSKLNKNNDHDPEDEDYSIFEPTSEWKPLRKDQAIPRGLHVRLNLATGKREAKLLDPNEKEDEVQDISAVTSDIKDEDSYRNLNELEDLVHLLRKVKGDEPLVADDDLERVKKKFRSYEELKEELKDIQASVKTDMELMNSLVENYRELAERKSIDYNEETKEEIDAEELSLLTDLEFLVHQIDNAREFVKFGLKEVVFPSLNSTSSKVRYEATKLLGSSVQSNPIAQIRVLEAGAVPILLRTLSIDSSYKVKSGAMYALSCLLRRFPAAQAVFIKKGGVTTLHNLFQSGTSEEIQLEMKITAFLNDLLVERKDTEETLKLNVDSFLEKELTEKLKQYKEMALEVKLSEGGWCSLLEDTLISSFEELTKGGSLAADEATALGEDPLHPEHQLISDVASILTFLAPSCGGESALRLGPPVSQLIDRYSHLTELEDDVDSVFAQLMDKMVFLQSRLVLPHVREEL